MLGAECVFLPIFSMNFRFLAKCCTGKDRYKLVYATCVLKKQHQPATYTLRGAEALLVHETWQVRVTFR
jgi:hypothetical protein